MMGLRWYEEAGDTLDYRLRPVLVEHHTGPHTVVTESLPWIEIRMR